MSVHLVHTARVHCATFDRLRDLIAPGVEVSHHVHESWLDRARRAEDNSLKVEIADYLSQLHGPVLCTCTTIGPMAEAAGALRIDWPMMQAAAQTKGSVLLVYCLESTREPSRVLLQRALDDVGSEHSVIDLPLLHLWPLFEAGKADEFSTAIAKGIRQTLNIQQGVKTVILAQASMAAAADRLEDVEIPVLSSPRLALEVLLGLGGVKAG
ncbi:hypothetical protein [Roseovarius rhodophyticola]|uniref:Asp/Glu racemase n=1 Tax=Roseovarius rhodophyticola TaxID=3080827 RepID=A0ABZ2TJQ5_9RHOB|nr:hypothetical protein [Roseovarius sp. W115]MDV2930276.1 hypothetical protein [Roseovarius sp. W115]